MLTVSTAAMHFTILVCLLVSWFTAVQSFSPPLKNFKPATIIQSQRQLYINGDLADPATSVGGGVIKSRSRKIETKQDIHAVSTLEEFNAIVKGEKDHIVVVRYHSTFCKACQQIQVAYSRLAKRYTNVKFVDVSITDKNNLRETLTIPGVPFGHIYHPYVGLVEESPMSRRYFSKFKKTLQTYIHDECDLPDEFFENPHYLYENENLIL